MPTAERPDPTAELLQRARTGDAAATAALFARFLPAVRGLVALRQGRRLLDIHDQDDLVQEALLAALRGLDQVQATTAGAFTCWLASIVENRLRNAARSAAAGKRGGGNVVRRADLGTTLASVAGADPAGSPATGLAARQLDGPLERALLALGSPSRELVYCRLVLGMEFQELAAAHDLASADSARAMFHKAVARLRERLEPGHQEPPAH